MQTSKTFNFEGVDIKYRWREGSQDRRSLIVIFSGFRAPGTLDFTGAPINGLRSDILWIEDELDGINTYYLGTKSRQKIREAIVALINHMAQKLGVEHDNIVLAGFSKGASAALFYGMQYDFKNILAVVPQFQIGNYVKKNWPKVHTFMSEGDAEYGEQLDAILPALARKADLSQKNIYLISSPADPYHATEVEPHLNALRKAGNFSYVLSKSDLVDSHVAVTRYNVPLIVSLFQSFGEGIYPRLGEVSNGTQGAAKPPIAAELPRDLVSKVTNWEVKDGRLLLAGESIIRGVASPNYVGVRRGLTATPKTAGAKPVKYPLGTLLDKSLSTTYYQRSLVNYTAGLFTTVARAGLDLTELDHGTYELNLEMSVHAEFRTHVLCAPRTVDSVTVHDGEMYWLRGEKDKNLQISKVDARVKGTANEYFKLEQLEADGSTLLVEGRYVVIGFNHHNYGASRFFLTLVGPGGKTSFPLGVLRRDMQSGEPTDPVLDYSHSTFSTPKRSGLNLSEVPPGDYEVYVTVHNAGYVSSRKADTKLRVSGTYSELAPLRPGVSQPKYSIVGSCVTRDNFNSRIAPHWKSHATLSAVQYQMSMVSLVAEPVTVTDEELAGLDTHSKEATVRDFHKGYFTELAINEPDVVIVDAYGDARFAVLEIDGSYVTHNDWKLPGAAGYKKWKTGARLSMAKNPEAYLKVFRTAVKEFRRRVLSINPKVTFVLNQARNIEIYYEDGLIHRFANATLKEQNSWWDSLDEILVDELDPVILKTMTPGLHSVVDHPWGKGPVHFDSTYYRNFAIELRKSLGYQANIKVI